MSPSGKEPRSFRLMLGLCAIVYLAWWFGVEWTLPGAFNPLPSRSTASTDTSPAFLEVERPTRLVWQHTDHGQRKEGPPTSHTTLTFEELGTKTRWTMVARFNSMAERDAAVAIGFSQPIAESGERLSKYLDTMKASL